MRTPGTDESVIVAQNNATQIALTFDDNRLASTLFGQYGQNLALIERRLGVVANSRGNHVTLEGTHEACELARRVLESLYERLKRGDELVQGDVYQWGPLMAGALLGSLPVAFIYSFFVEYYVSGLTGSVKE